MPSTGRRSQELPKKLERRNNSLKPSDFTKDHYIISHMETKKDPVEKSKASLSDLRKRIDERKRASKLIDVKQYEEKREESIPELTGVTFSESPTSERQQESPVQESPPQNRSSLRTDFAMSKTAPEKVLSRNIKNYYKDEDRYRKDFSQEFKVLPSQIEVRSGVAPDVEGDDDNTEVSEITTDVRIMSTKGATFAERRMASNVQMRLARPALSTPKGNRLERDINIDVSNLRQLGEAVEKAKIDLRKEMSPTNVISRRNGLPYEDTDYKPSADEDEIDSWGDAIRTDFKKSRSTINSPSQKEESTPFVADKIAAKKLQSLVKEAYSYEGDVFIDATEIREEDLDAEERIISKGKNHSNPIKVEDDTTLGTSDLPVEELPKNLDDKKNSQSDIADENYESDDETLKDDDKTLEDLEKKPFGFNKSNPVSIASDIYNSSLGFLKSFSSQVDTQLKALQESGLITKVDMDGMLGILEHDVKETGAKFSKDGDDAAMFLSDELQAPVCGADLKTSEQNNKTNTESKHEAVENMLESLKKSYNLGISKCGIDSDLIKENTKAIEAMVIKLQKAKGNSPEAYENDNPAENIINESNKSLSKETEERNLLKELSARGVEDMIKDPTKNDSEKTFIVSVNMSADV